MPYKSILPPPIVRGVSTKVMITNVMITNVMIGYMKDVNALRFMYTFFYQGLIQIQGSVHHEK